MAKTGRYRHVTCLSAEGPQRRQKQAVYTLSGNSGNSDRRPVPVLFCRQKHQAASTPSGASPKTQPFPFCFQCRFLASETDDPARNTGENLLPKPQYRFQRLLLNASNWQLWQRITVANCCQNIRRYRSSDFDLIHSDFADFETEDVDNPGNIEMLPKPQYKILFLPLFSTRN